MILFINDFAELRKGVVPLGYDYDCDKDKCKGTFRSLNSIMSDSISKALI